MHEQKTHKAMDLFGWKVAYKFTENCQQGLNIDCIFANFFKIHHHTSAKINCQRMTIILPLKSTFWSHKKSLVLILPVWTKAANLISTLKTGTEDDNTTKSITIIYLQQTKKDVGEKKI